MKNTNWLSMVILRWLIHCLFWNSSLWNVAFIFRNATTERIRIITLENCGWPKCKFHIPGQKNVPHDTLVNPVIVITLLHYRKVSSNQWMKSPMNTFTLNWKSQNWVMINWKNGFFIGSQICSRIINELEIAVWP